jgi:hypothetical protein
MAETLNLHLLVDAGREFECACALQERLTAGQFRILAQLAADIVARWETVHSGQRIAVVPAAEAGAEVARHLRLRPVVPE